MANTTKDEAEEQQRDTSSSPLPSYGMSKFVDITDQETMKKLLEGINKGNLSVQNMRREAEGDEEQVVLRVHSSSFDNESGNSSSSGSSSQAENQNDVARIFDSGNQFVKMEGDALKEEALENSYVLDFLGTLGNTECIQTANLNTIDSQQIQQPVGMVSGDDDQLFGEGVAMEVTVVESQLEMENLLEPKIKFTEVAKYSRFRYESERTKTQRVTKGRTADQADDYKSLGTIKIEGYAGKAQLVVFCVDAQDRIHPYSLHGDFCDNGIYQQVMDLKGDISIKLNKVSFTTPKSKQYHTIFKKRREDLKNFHINVDSMRNTDMEKSDKNTVYLHAEVLLGDVATRKHTVSDAIHNKKEGNEFKIYTIEPASAPAIGYHPGNPNKNRVLIVVTDGTAFPKHVGVKIRSKTGQAWEVMVPKKDITCIKKAVVEFIPPPFRNPNTDTNEEMEVCLVDEDTKDESNSVQFLYYSVQDLDGVDERRRKKPKLDGSPVASCSRQLPGASMSVLGSLDPEWKQKFEAEMQPAVGNIDLPKYSEMYDNQRQAEAGNGKIYSLKDNTQNDDLVPRGPRGRSVQLKEETGQGRSCMVPGASQGPLRRSDLPELKQSQMTVNLPKQSANWSQGLQNQNLPARPSTTAVVTSTSGSSANKKVGYNSLEPTVAYPPRLASISEETQQNDLQMQREQLQPQQTEPDRQLAWQQQQILQEQQQQILQEQQAGQTQDQQSDFQGYQAQSAAQQTQSLGGHQALQQLQFGQLQIQSTDFQLHQAQSATLQPQNQIQSVQQQQQILQQQNHQVQQAQQQQQQQATSLPENQMQQEQPNSSLAEKRLKHELLSKILEQQARQLNPDFKLEPNQMFLLLGNNLTIADKSLVDCAFSLPATHPLSSTLEQSMNAQSQRSTNQVQGQVQGMPGNCEQSGTASGILQQIGQPYGGQSQALQIQPPPLVQQQSYSHLQNPGTLIAGADIQLRNPLSLPAQQYSGSSQPLQRGTSIGLQPNFSMGQGGGIQQRSVQSGQSIFPRNNLPFSSANLDDDDVEIDSEGPKRKKPIQLYGKSSKKANNGSDRNVIDLTIENNETVNGNSDLKNDDLETDYSGPDSANKYDCKVVLKRMDASHKIPKLSGVYRHETVRKESGSDIETDMVAEDSGIFSMEEKT